MAEESVAVLLRRAISLRESRAGQQVPHTSRNRGVSDRAGPSQNRGASSAGRHPGNPVAKCKGATMSDPIDRRAFVAASAAAGVLAGQAAAQEAPAETKKDRIVRLDLLTSREVGE